MLDHPFVSRVRSERMILKAVNERADLLRAPLPGLAPESIRRWAATSLGALREDVREALISLLLEASAKLRLGSSSSHRGAIASPRPDPDDVVAEVDSIRRLLSCDEGADRGELRTNFEVR